MSLSIPIGKNKFFFILLIVFTFLFKTALAAYFSHLGSCGHPELDVGHLAKATGDTFSYIGSIDNFINEGTFYFWNGERKVFAGRMPYYGAPYYILRLIFDKPLASDLFVLLQIFFDTLATIYFAKLCRKILNSKTAFVVGYVLYFLSFNFFETALLLTTESLSMSFLVLFFYAFHSYWKNLSKEMLWTANIFLSLTFLLKPYLAPLFLLFLAVYCYRENLFSFNKLKILIVKTALFCLPVGLLLLPWFLRNLIVLNQPIVTQESVTAGYKDTEADKAFRRFTGGWGGDATYWDASSPACYFKLNPPVQCTFSLPAYSLTDKYTLQDIEDVRSDYLAYQKNPSPELEQSVVNKFDRLAEIYKQEKPFMFYFGSGLIRSRTMLWHTNNYYFPVYWANPCFETYQLIFKGLQTIIYQLSLVLGLVGIIWLTVKRKISFIFLFLPLFLVIFFSFYIRYTEARYFAHAYSVLLLGLTAIINLLVYKIKSAFLENYR